MHYIKRDNTLAKLSVFFTVVHCNIYHTKYDIKIRNTSVGNEEIQNNIGLECSHVEGLHLIEK